MCACGWCRAHARARADARAWLRAHLERRANLCVEGARKGVGVSDKEDAAVEVEFTPDREVARRVKRRGAVGLGHAVALEED
eukprot:2261372-Pleurochrysis_carterae.AAC.2